MRDDRADQLVRLYLSWFSVCRIIKLAKPIKASTFRTIVTPIKDMGRVKEVCSELKQNVENLFRRYLPWVNSIPLEKGFQFVPSWKSTPNDLSNLVQHKIQRSPEEEEARREARRQLREERKLKKLRPPKPNLQLHMCSKKVTGSDEQPAPKERKETCFFSAMFLEIAAFARQLRIIHSEPDGIFSPGILFQPGYTLYPFDTQFSTWAANEGLSFYEAWPGLVFDSLAMGFDRSSQPLYSGRLAQSLEGGRKAAFVCNR